MVSCRSTAARGGRDGVVVMTDEAVARRRQKLRCVGGVDFQLNNQR